MAAKNSVQFGIAECASAVSIPTKNRRCLILLQVKGVHQIPYQRCCAWFLWLDEEQKFPQHLCGYDALLGHVPKPRYDVWTDS